MKNYDNVSICDIGAGDRYFDLQLLNRLKQKGVNTTIFAVDNQYTELKSNTDDVKLHDTIKTIQKKSMDCIIMMDVLEHIEDDITFLQEAVDLLKENGVLVVTVPAFESLFSSHDRFLKHYRRYNYSVLSKLITPSEMKIEYCHYFFFSLLVLRFLQVKFGHENTNNANAGVGRWRFSTRNIITKMLRMILNLDFIICRILAKIGLRIPGLSLLCVATKTVI